MSRLKKTAGDLFTRIENTNKTLNDLSSELNSLAYNLEQYIKTNASTLENEEFESLKETVGIIKNVYYAVEDGTSKLDKELGQIGKSLN